MNDPRLVLSDELQLLGIPERTAATIALDAGSSQVVIDADYLISVTKNDENYNMGEALKVIQDFYSGALFGEFDD